MYGMGFGGVAAQSPKVPPEGMVYLTEQQQTKGRKKEGFRV